MSKMSSTGGGGDPHKTSETVCGTLEFEMPVSMRWTTEVLTGTISISPTFYFQGNEWCLWIKYIARYTRPNNMSIYMRCLKLQRMFVPYSATVKLESYADGRVMSEIPAQTKNVRSLPPHVIGLMFPCEIWRGTSGDIEKVDAEFLSSRRLTFHIVFKAAPEDKSAQTSFSLTPTACLESLSDDLATLLDKGSNTDVELECGGQSTKAHRAVLSARSPVLASMLRSDEVEGIAKVIKVPDTDEETFHHFLRYLYTGKLNELTNELAQSLYRMGKNYEVQNLTRSCSEFLAEHLTSDNAYDVMAIASKDSDDPDFVEAVVVYMVEKNFPTSSDRWSSFSESHPELAVRVLNRICKK